MRTIHKYQIITADVIEVTMPASAEIICLQPQHGIPCIWAMVDTEEALKPRRLFTYGTGHPAQDENQRYIGTYQLHNGQLVFHVFEEIL